MSKRQILVWAPVFLLPLSNLFSAIYSGAGYDGSEAVVWVIGAISEELVFRYFLLRKFLLRREEIRPPAAIILVAVLFAVMHLYNLRTGTAVAAVLVQAVCAFCFSVWAGAVVWRRQSVLVPLLAHVLLNLTASDGTGELVPLVISLITLIDGIMIMR